MNTRRRIAATVLVPVALAAVLSSCADGHRAQAAQNSPSDAPSAVASPVTAPIAPTATLTPTSTQTQTSEPSSHGDTAPRNALADGRHAAWIVRADARSRTVTIDEVQYLMGDAAASAAAEAGAEVPPPNDYFVKNASHLLRTLPVAPDAPITTNGLTGLETGSSSMDVRVSFERLASFRHLETAALFWIMVKNGTVVRINEQYRP